MHLTEFNANVNHQLTLDVPIQWMFLNNLCQLCIVRIKRRYMGIRQQLDDTEKQIDILKSTYCR